MSTEQQQQKQDPSYSWQQTMLRIKDPKATIKFYQDHFGMKLLHYYHFEASKFSNYFMGILPNNENPPAEPGTKEAETYLWTYPYVTLELTHNHGTENDPNFKHNNGNVEPNRGFGHIAFFTDDVYESCQKLEDSGVKFQKKPDEGRMKGLAFALDPDGYWIEIIKRSENSPYKGYYNLCQTMLRVKDPQKSLHFYKDVLGLSLLRELHFSDAKFSLFFLASLNKEEKEKFVPKSSDSKIELSHLFKPVLELTHNHGTENDAGFSYHNGNTEPKGFGHIGFLVDDLEATCKDLEFNKNVPFKKRPHEGSMRGIAFILDPDGYWVEIIQRGASFQ